MEVLQTQSGRPKGPAKVSHGKAGTGLKESAGAPRNPLLLHSPIPAQYLLVPCSVIGPLHADSLFGWDSGFVSHLGLGLPLSAWSKIFPPSVPKLKVPQSLHL